MKIKPNLDHEDDDAPIAMPADLVALIAAHGGAELAWRSFGSVSRPGWSVQVRNHYVAAHLHLGQDCWMFKTHEREVKKNDWILFDAIERSEPLAALFAEMSQPDPRLATLPEDLRAIAEEFLSLHGAWGTEFEAIGGAQAFHLTWPLGRTEDVIDITPWATFKFVLLALRENPPSWVTAWRVGWGDESHAGEAVGRLATLRRSADFAEFVQRFREGRE